jgi:LmbE family N-acetylglucosaminyl deacetylase
MRRGGKSGSREASLLDSVQWSRFERLIVLSPHLDDAALSCGGLLSVLKGRISRLVVTISCGSPIAGKPRDEGRTRRRTPHRRKGHVRPADRRREDIEAMHSIDCDFVHLGFADAIYRRSPTSGHLIYRSSRSKWCAPSREDAGYIEELYFVLHRLCVGMGPVILLSPLGAGFHVDHSICAQVALRLGGRNVKLMFYEDFPYVVRGPTGIDIPDDPDSAMDRLGIEPVRRLTSPYDITAKARLIVRYATQFPDLFGDEQTLWEQLSSRSQRGVPVEVFWETRVAKRQGIRRSAGGDE